MEYGIMSDIDISKEAKQLHDEARQLGAKGEYVRSIELLDEAQVLSPDWPYPTYDKAYTYLLMKDYAKSRECYKKTIELSPRGFFTAIAALDALNREADGDLPEGTYLAFMSLEWLDDPAQKARAVTSMVEQLPDFAPAWEKYASLSDDPIERVKRIEKGLAANPDAETKGMLLMNKAIAINMQGDNQAAIGVLGDLILDSEATFSSVNLAKQVLAQIAK